MGEPGSLCPYDCTIGEQSSSCISNNPGATSGTTWCSKVGKATCQMCVAVVICCDLLRQVKHLIFLDTESCYWQLAQQHSMQYRAHSKSGIPHLGALPSACNMPPHPKHADFAPYDTVENHLRHFCGLHSTVLKSCAGAWCTSLSNWRTDSRDRSMNSSPREPRSKGHTNQWASLNV